MDARGACRFARERSGRRLGPSTQVSGATLTLAAKKPLRLDLGAGQNCAPGFAGVDIKPGAGVKYVADLFQAPWPFKTGSVAETVSNHVVEHIPHYRPEYAGVDGWWVFFNELHRVCADGAKCVFTHPYAKHQRAFWDPTHTRYLHEVTWSYLDKGWREAQRLDHYDATCDFEVVVINGIGLAQELTARNAEYQQFARQHWWDQIPDLAVELRVRKP